MRRASARQVEAQRPATAHGGAAYAIATFASTRPARRSCRTGSDALPPLSTCITSTTPGRATRRSTPGTTWARGAGHAIVAKPAREAKTWKIGAMHPSDRNRKEKQRTMLLFCASDMHQATIAANAWAKRSKEDELHRILQTAMIVIYSDRSPGRTSSISRRRARLPPDRRSARQPPRSLAEHAIPSCRTYRPAG